MNRRISFILWLVCIASFAAGVVELMRLRYEGGDVYPAYSSLRFDPLGTSALYESYGRIPGITVNRDFRMTDELPEARNAAYLHLAADRYEWNEMPESLFKEIQSFLARGGRLVITFFPETRKPDPRVVSFMPKRFGKTKSASPQSKNNNKNNSGTNSNTSTNSTPGDEDADDQELLHTVSLKDKWAVDFDFKPLKQGKDDMYEPVEVQNDSEPSLPALIEWHSGMIFTNLAASAWRVIYTREGDPVMIERKFGTGSVVLASDSFFLSNEALEHDRHAELLAWIAGPCHQIVFDEAHLGIVENPGVAALIRKYRLHGLMLGLLLLAGLFIWKNSVSLLPAHKEEEVDIHVAGKDSATGFINLLRRHIRSRDVLATCLTEWKKSVGNGKISTARLERVQAVIDAENAKPPAERNPILAYRAICEALRTKSGFVTSTRFSADDPKSASGIAPTIQT